MKDSDFGELRGSLKEALEHARGERSDLRTTKLQIIEPPPPMSTSKIVQLRRSLGCSQGMFAKALNVSPRTIQSWEQGVRAPSATALRLLDIIQKNPGVLIAPGRGAGSAPYGQHQGPA